MFAPYKHNGQPQPLEYYEVTTSETIALGEALVLSSGLLTKCGATAAPKFIAMEPIASAPAGSRIAVVRVSKDVIYDTILSVDSASIAKGAAYTLASNGLAITATTTSGVAEVVEWDGKKAGDHVRVRF